MRVPDSLLIPALISSEIWRRFARRVRSGPLYRWRFAGTTPSGLVMAPQDLRPADPQRAVEFYSGQFSFGDESIITGGDTPFAVTAPSTEWFTQLHGFRWLRHHRAVNTDLSHANANAMVTDWIELWGHQLNSQAWRSDIVASRIVAWFCHAPLLVKSASADDYRLMLKSLARQTRYLQHNVPHMRDGYPRLQATIALAYASLCLAGREKSIKSVARDLDRELDRQILPDGGHISRNPVILLEILTELLPLKQAYDKQGQRPSKNLISAVDRMMSALRFFRHSNGDLAQFNGTGYTPNALLATILRYDSAKGPPQQSAPHSGFQRLAGDKTVVLVDTGKPTSRAAARRSLAGTLSFEMSCGQTRFISNCGVPSATFQLYAPFARATAAHSTVTVNDTSSSQFSRDTGIYRLLPSPLIRSPERVSVERVDEEAFSGIIASHDGYQKQFGLDHSRELFLSTDGNTINGQDTLAAGQEALPEETIAAIRFHLPAMISVSKLSSGHSIMIAAPNNDAWVFTCLDAPIVLEESIQFSGPGQPRKSEQIVIYFHPAERNTIKWVLERRITSTSENRKNSRAKVEAPDLLDALEQAKDGSD